MSTPGDGPAMPPRPPLTAVPLTSGASRIGTTRADPLASRIDADGPPRKVRSTKRPPRITSLQLKRLDPWTVLKVSLIVAIVMFFIWMIAVGLLYALFGSLDVVSRINVGWRTVTSADSTAVASGDLITAGGVFGIAAVIGAINIVVITALATVAAFVYNAAAGMAGGVELTLGERD